MDRIIRLGVGPILMMVGIAGYVGLLTVAVGPLPQAITSVLVMLIGVVLLITGLIQRCPINRILGFNTYRKNERRESETPTATNHK